MDRPPSPASSTPKIEVEDQLSRSRSPSAFYKRPEEQQEAQCRICFEGVEAVKDMGRLIRPCLCKGTISYVHVKCLDKWRRLSHNKSNSFKCPQCHYSYRFGRTRVARLASNRVVLLVLTSILFVLLTLLVGCLTSLLLVKHNMHFDPSESRARDFILVDYHEPDFPGTVVYVMPDDADVTLLEASPASLRFERCLAALEEPQDGEDDDFDFLNDGEHNVVEVILISIGRQLLFALGRLLMCACLELLLWAVHAFTSGEVTRVLKALPSTVTRSMGNTFVFSDSFCTMIFSSKWLGLEFSPPAVKLVHTFIVGLTMIGIIPFVISPFIVILLPVQIALRFPVAGDELEEGAGFPILLFAIFVFVGIKRAILSVYDLTRYMTGFLVVHTENAILEVT